jgi:hypothetical protein
MFRSKAVELTFGLGINAQITEMHIKLTGRYFLEICASTIYEKYFLPHFYLKDIRTSDSVKCRICKLAR